MHVSIYLPINLPTYLFIYHLSIYLSTRMYRIYLPINQSIYLFIYLPINQSIYLSIYPHMCVRPNFKPFDDFLRNLQRKLYHWRPFIE
jgi:hypothetical protein